MDGFRGGNECKSMQWPKKKIDRSKDRPRLTHFMCLCACKITQAGETRLTSQCSVGESVTHAQADRLRQRGIVREDTDAQTNLSAHFKHNGPDNWLHLSAVTTRGSAALKIGYLLIQINRTLMKYKG